MKLARPSFRAVLGSFRILGRRVHEVGHPSIASWSQAGEREVIGIGQQIRDLSHKNECQEQSLATRVREIVSDNRVTPAELAELRKMPHALTTCAERSHQIGEVVHL